MVRSALSNDTDHSGKAAGQRSSDAGTWQGHLVILETAVFRALGKVEASLSR